MCKLYIASGRATRPQAERVLQAVNRSFAASQRDGFGFALFAGRDMRTLHRYADPNAYGAGASDDAIVHGTVPRSLDAMLVHGRTGTGGTGVRNAHPFAIGPLTLVHNGVVYWKGRGRAPDYECDSARFLSWLVDEDRRAGGLLAAFRNAHKSWSGWGAIAVHDSRTGDVTVAKCSSTRLHCSGTQSGQVVLATDPRDLLLAAAASEDRLTRDPAPLQSALFTLRRGEIGELSQWRGFGETRFGDDYTRSTGLVAGRGGRQLDLDLESAQEPFPDWDPDANSR